MIDSWGALWRVAVLALALLLGTETADAAEKKESAFGFWKSMTLRQVKAAAPMQKVPNASFYATTQPPSPVYPFAFYTVAVGRSAGVCVVLAQTEHMPQGSKMFKDTAANIIEIFMDRYGSPTHSGESDTSKTMKWENAQGPNTSVQVTTQWADDGTVYIQAGYTFSNLAQCREELQGGV
jgi:hypothetical protein